MSVASLTQNDIVDAIVDNLVDQYDDGVIEPSLVKDVLAMLREVVLDEVEQGIKVNVLNLVTLAPRFTAGKPKGWRYNPFVGEDVYYDKSTPAVIKVKARPTASVQSCAPSANSTAGRQIAKEATAAKNRREKQARARERAAA